MHNFKELNVWKKAIDLSELVYRNTRQFPTDERFGLTSQIRRAVVSVSANIAEGAGRKSDKEFLNFLSIANGSCFELQSHIIIPTRLEYIEKDIANEVLSLIIEIQKMIHALSQKLKRELV